MTIKDVDRTAHTTSKMTKPRDPEAVDSDCRESGLGEGGVDGGGMWVKTNEM